MYRILIEKKGKLGLLHKFVKDSDVSVLASFANLDKDEIDKIHSQPLFASGFDYT